MLFSCVTTITKEGFSVCTLRTAQLIFTTVYTHTNSFLISYLEIHMLHDIDSLYMFCIQQHIHIFFLSDFFTSSWLRVDRNGYSCKQTAYRNITQSTRLYFILVWYEGRLCDLHQVISIVRVLFGWSLLVVARGTCSWEEQSGRPSLLSSVTHRNHDLCGEKDGAWGGAESLLCVTVYCMSVGFGFHLGPLVFGHSPNLQTSSGTQTLWLWWLPSESQSLPILTVFLRDKVKKEAYFLS